jgi:hypothetical protein
VRAIDPHQEVAAVRLARAAAQAALERGEQVDLDVVVVLAAARHHDEPAAHELVALALTLHPGEKVVDVGEHRLWHRGRFGYDHLHSADCRSHHTTCWGDSRIYGKQECPTAHHGARRRQTVGVSRPVGTSTSSASGCARMCRSGRRSHLDAGTEWSDQSSVTHSSLLTPSTP